MKAKVIDVNGKEINEIELDDFIFNIKPNRTVIYESLKNELANKRQGNASTKTKAEVSGTGAKPWKQKGTGRARVGTKRNPVWYHGGVAFGPKPRDYSYKLPKKIKNLAYRSLLSWKMKSNDIVIVKELKVESGKTKDLNKIMDKVIDKSKVVMIVADSENDTLIRRTGKNLAWLNFLNCQRLNIHSLLYAKKLLFTEESVLMLNKFLKKEKVEG